MSQVTIAHLIANGTLNTRMAAQLWSAIDDQLSFMTVALPRLAGKSTTANALLALRPPGMAVTQVAGEPGVMEALKRERRGGYLQVNEFSQAPMYGYIWGDPVRRVFDTLPYGYALQTSLHARSVGEAIDVVCRGNGVSDEQASNLKLILYIERFGTGMSEYWRRIVEVFEVDSVKGGRPVGRTLWRWRPADDAFEQVDEPRGFARDEARVRVREHMLSDLVREGRMEADHVADAVGNFHREFAQ